MRSNYLDEDFDTPEEYLDGLYHLHAIGVGEAVRHLEAVYGLMPNEARAIYYAWHSVRRERMTLRGPSDET
tara:strand:- start:981 stop:1193 length:213 start_codon:yes stop_codon:yes gene_type:complete